MMSRSLIVVFGVFALMGFLVASGVSQEQGGKWLASESIEVTRVKSGLRVTCQIQIPKGSEGMGELRFVLMDLDGKTLLEVKSDLDLPLLDQKASVILRGDVEDEKIPLCVLKYRLKVGKYTEEGSRSLMASLAQLETRIVAYRELLAGTKASLQIVALNHATGNPVNNAQVTISLIEDEKERTLFQGRTRRNGAAMAQFDVPEDVEGSRQLKVTVEHERLGKDEILQTVSIQKKTKILLTTDKPLYQPGQLIHMRTLCLAAGTLAPQANQSLTFEVMDSKGNKVFKKAMETDDFGIASTEFHLATELNLGTYIVRAILDSNQTEKTVGVQRYVLPKFKVQLKSERDFYLPGETLKGEVQADYMFGKPVSGGKVTVVASKFEIQFDEFETVEGTLSEEGHWEFEMKLPDYFAGTPLEQGKTSVRLEAKVVDTAEHREDKVIMVPVSDAPLSLFAIPESGSLVPNLKNNVYILVSYPDGSPCKNAAVTVEYGDVDEKTREQNTNDVGIAVVSLTPKGMEPTHLTIRAKDAEGRTASKEFALDPKSTAESLILRTDKALYQVGETIQADVIASKKKGTVYLDMIREGQAVMTYAGELQSGRASLAVDIDASMSGSVALQAYIFTPGTDLVRDTRLLYVNPADALKIAIALDTETYKPGQSASIDFRITNDKGKPVVSALGISIVDEAVFALQEIHPGLEKVYFTLEQEIMKPRYEIHGYELDDLVKLPPQPGPIVRMSWNEDQQQAARVLLASAPSVPEPPIRVNTFAEKQQKATDALMQRYQKDYERIQGVVQRYLSANNWKAPEKFLEALIRGKYLRENEILDPWGNAYIFDFSQVEATRGYFTMTSKGSDEIIGTADDLGLNMWFGRGGRQMLRRGAGIAEAEFALGAPVGVFDMAGAPQAAVAVEERLEKSALAFGVDEDASVGGASAPEAVRLREYFPETLLFEPALITDARGQATLSIDMADSITTWRMTAMASSKTGALGSTEHPIRVFQDFFVDIDLPVALTKNDRVSIPVVLYNYLDSAQKVRIKFDVEPWFELEGDAEQIIELGSEEVRPMYFPIQVKELGKHRLTVWAYGEKMSDAIRREIEVLPDGDENNITFSDRLSNEVEQTIFIPSEAIDGASKILVRIYPGVYSQIVDGLDSMLRMPSGCFEQTSSVSYPNVLIVQYMKATKQINPETQMTAEGFINAGYQRLLSYEVDGGGFSWFGDAPANKVLTAFGLKQFYDMAKVHEVDPAVIDRTRAWLLSKQESNGAWKPDENYLHAESWSGIQKSDVLVTAYIADAILSSEGTGAGADKAIEYLRANWKDAEEAYVVSLIANALVSWNAKDVWTAEVLKKLHDMAVVEKETAHWKGGTGTVTFTHGDAADVETTALAAIAFLRSGKYPETTGKALTYLIQKKGAYGHWGSTQATILALKAMMLSLGNRTEEVDATIAITLNGEKVSELKVTPEDSDVMRLVDLGEQTKEGENKVNLTLQGEGSLLYQIVGRYYIPWTQRPAPEEPMTITVNYDRTELAVNDLATLNVKVKNNRPAAAQMVIVDVGTPPGFQVQAADLESLVEKKIFSKYEMTPRQVIAYFEKIEGNKTIEFSYTIQAKFPLRAKTPQSRVYEYYNPEVSHISAPIDLTVE